MVHSCMEKLSPQANTSKTCSGLESSKDNEVLINQLRCDQCRESFPTLVAKRKHDKFYHFFSKPFACECGQQFGKLSEINYHIRRVHNKEKNYVCHVCNKSFFKNSDLLIHKTVHEASAKFICEDCGRRFKHVSNLIRHSRTHTGIKPYLCIPCDKRFSQVAALRQHEITEKHKKKIKERSINKTDKLRENELVTDEILPGLEKEMNSLKLGKEKTKWWFYCKICGERFPFSVLLRDHETKHIVNGDARCNACKTEFSSLKEFSSHACTINSKVSYLKKDEVNQIQKDADDSNINKCEKEDEKDKDKKVALTLTQNGQIMLDDDEVLLTLNDKVYGFVLINNDVTVVQNDECLHILNGCNRGESLVKGSSIEAEAVVTGPPPNDWMIKDEIMKKDTLDRSNDKRNSKGNKSASKLSCNECGKNFMKKINYIRHLGTHSMQLNKYKCQDCMKKFSWNSSLKNHILRKHTEKKQYSCNHCPKTYFSTILVKDHVKRDHLNIRSHKCTICEKAFFRRYDLKVHLRIHTDERPYNCGACGKRFRHLSHRIRHDRTHLKDSPSSSPPDTKSSS